ncbi:BnaC05g09270D [Brassica napus]|uniref:BnaC05g09270D protein n=1 Tax=Brassica napus TaxID=3708 RepID=A0A078G3Z1_BRANA|nr:BnaC05g09270D [Brassica napus]
MNGDGVWLDDAGERSQAGYNDEPVPWVRNPEENWFNNSQPHDDSQNEFRFNNATTTATVFLSYKSLHRFSPQRPHHQQQQQPF